jgi:hypothetical protein
VLVAELVDEPVPDAVDDDVGRDDCVEEPVAWGEEELEAVAVAEDVAELEADAVGEEDPDGVADIVAAAVPVAVADGVGVG